MLSKSEERFLKIIKGWMDEPNTTTYLCCITDPKYEDSPENRMSDELEIALVEAGVKPPPGKWLSGPLGIID